MFRQDSQNEPKQLNMRHNMEGTARNGDQQNKGASQTKYTRKRTELH